MNEYSWAWIAWGAGTLTTFAVIEAIAYLGRRDGVERVDTLTSHVQALTGRHRFISAALFSAFCAWLVAHFWA